MTSMKEMINVERT